jgi:hypothetical protein
MNLSAHNAKSGQEDVRGVLARWLNDYIAGRCGGAEMQESVLRLCRSHPDVPWDALTLLEHYRGSHLDEVLVRSLKVEIAQLVFGEAHQA